MADMQVELKARTVFAWWRFKLVEVTGDGEHWFWILHYPFGDWTY